MAGVLTWISWHAWKLSVTFIHSRARGHIGYSSPLIAVQRNNADGAYVIAEDTTCFALTFSFSVWSLQQRKAKESDVFLVFSPDAMAEFQFRC